MRYIFRTCYTPTDAAYDRKRTDVFIEAIDQRHAMADGISNLEMTESEKETARIKYTDTVMDVGRSWAWYSDAAKGSWYFSIDSFETTDPVTKESIWEWAKECGDKPGILATQILYDLLGRWSWRCLDNEGSFDLKQQLHEIMLEGYSPRPYKEMSHDELLEAVMEEVVAHKEGDYDELGKQRPFGMTTMIADDKELWLGENRKQKDK